MPITTNSLNISVVIPVHNRSALLKRAVDSVLGQDIPLRELIVVDDHSSEDIDAVLSDFVNKESGTDIIYLRNDQNRGAQYSRNRGIEKASAEWIILLDSDNELYPGYSTCIADLLHDDKIDVVTHFSNVLDAAGELKEQFNWITNGSIEKEILMLEAYADNSSSTIRRAKLQEIGLLDEACPSYQEWDTHIRLSEISSYHTIEKSLTKYYTDSEDRMSDNLENSIAGKLYVLGKHRDKWLKKLGPAQFRKVLKSAYFEFNAQLSTIGKFNLIKQLSRLSILFPLNLTFYWVGYKLKLHD